MASTLASHTISDIIFRVEKDLGSSPFCSHVKFRRAHVLATEASNVLNILRNELTTEERARYQTFRHRTEVARISGNSDYLDVAEDFWNFAIDISQAVNHRHILAAAPPPPPVAAPVIPPCPVTPPAPQLQPCWWVPAVSCTPTWAAVPTLWSPNVTPWVMAPVYTSPAR